jgi:hypothetical protein
MRATYAVLAKSCCSESLTFHIKNRHTNEMGRLFSRYNQISCPTGCGKRVMVGVDVETHREEYWDFDESTSFATIPHVCVLDLKFLPSNVITQQREKESS